MPNVLPLDHTPSRGIPLQDDRPTLEADAPSKRSRTITGKLFRSRDGDAPAPTWLVLAATLLVGSGGTATVSTLFSPSVDPDRISSIEAGIAVDRAADIERDRELTAQAAKVAAIDARTNEAEIRMHRESVRSTRWMAEVLTIQNAGIAAIAADLNVKVDLTIPPLLPPEER